jgi:hypothetical protein
MARKFFEMIEEVKLKVHYNSAGDDVCEGTGRWSRINVKMEKETDEHNLDSYHYADCPVCRQRIRGVYVRRRLVVGGRVI